jgi:hypothetical protein
MMSFAVKVLVAACCCDNQQRNSSSSSSCCGSDTAAHMAAAVGAPSGASNSCTRVDGAGLLGDDGAMMGP